MIALSVAMQSVRTMIGASRRYRRFDPSISWLTIAPLVDANPTIAPAAAAPWIAGRHRGAIAAPPFTAEDVAVRSRRLAAALGGTAFTRDAGLG